MQGHSHSYLDLSVLKELRNCVISSDAVVLFNSQVDEIIWANAAGAQLFGGRGVVDLLSTKITESQSVVKQLKKAILKMGDTKSMVRGVRVNQGLRSLLIQFQIKRIKLPDDETGYRVTNYSKSDGQENETSMAKNAVDALEGFADAAAIFDDEGDVIASSQNFASTGPNQNSLLTLIDELKSEDDRLIKRADTASNGNTIAVGLARISNKPARTLIVVADTQANETKENEKAFPELEEIASPEMDIASQVSKKNTEEADTPYKMPAYSAETDEEPILDNFDEPDIEINLPDDTNDIKSQKPQKFDFEQNDGTVRFAWVIDENCVFKSVSPELAETVGENAANIVGRKWREVANVFGFDTSNEIEKLLKKQDTWSGKTVLWPVQGTDMVLPIDIAALPSFNSERIFEGFRGFGIIRTADAILDPDETGMALVSSQMPEKPVPSMFEETSTLQASSREEDEADADTSKQIDNSQDQTKPSNIVRLVPKGPSPAIPTLSQQESYAFRKIGKTLRGDDNKTSHEEKSLTSKQPKETQVEPTKQDPAANAEQKIKPFNPSGLDTSIMESLPVAIVIYNSDEILFTNHSFLNATGYLDTGELEKAGGIEAILIPDEVSGIPGKYFIQSKSGERKPIKPVLHTVPWGGDKALLISFATGNTEQINEPPALEMSSLSEIQNILDITSDGILVLDPNGEIVSINASAEALFNLSFDEAKQRNITTLFAHESRNSIRQYVENMTGPGIGQLFNDGQEVIAAEANGGMIPVFLTISKMQSSGKLCAVIRDMTSWKKTKEELIQSRHEAESASGHKTDFLANISHEIRTPLNSIIGFSDIMVEERFGAIKNERYREYLRDINRSGKHILELINDLLDLSKIESGKLELEFEAVDLNELVSETVALLQPQANDSRIIIRTSLSRAVPKVVADTRSIRQIILNLVSNAIKFSPTNSQVIVSTVYESNGEVALRIRDTGRGMNESQIQEAMKPFQQVHSETEERKGGTGLGLPLTKALVEANRALFDLESEPGKGTIAHVQFPTQRVLAD